MIKWIGRSGILLLLSACASGMYGGQAKTRHELWEGAHHALIESEYPRADSLFDRLSKGFPESVAGRESLFYLGALRIDPRNPRWNPRPAEDALRQYLAADSVDGVSIHRRPEAEVLLQLAQQLNLPAEERMPALQPGTKEVRVTERVVVPAEESRALAAEVERLRQQLADRDAQIRRQQDELERIRRTLTGRRQ